ncbi:hypothetical protein HH214_21325 [Mucilaginibacter robiniae]|uniref:Uncharacterized protein n=1 Tax=Mucilaginibacter robiniae TaxID=2728022 RepID=A0A7L5ECT4_9SPHI|nr:hypothetical protein [Mucilaginibacter robiniae]QJD98236.1 hypothetical protein HH214_21325 [Mucilaginibacter robiniae]
MAFGGNMCEIRHLCFFIHPVSLLMEIPGFVVKVENGLDVKAFLEKNFPGFNPTEVSAQADALLGPMAITAITRKWTLTDPPPHINFYFGSKDAFVEKTGVCLSRTFRCTEQGVVVHHDYFTIPEQHRHQGTGIKILKSWFDLYVAMNIRKILVHATLEDGGYVWARVGFKATRRDEVDKILARAKRELTTERFSVIQGYYDDHYNNFVDQPFPLEYWARISYMKSVLKASSWHGQIDLTNESEMTNFNKYVSQ